MSSGVIPVTSLGPSTNAVIIGGSQYLLGSFVGFVVDTSFHWGAQHIGSGDENGKLALVERILLNVGQAVVNSFFIHQSLIFLYGDGRPATRDPVAGVPFLLGLISHQPFFFKNANHCCGETRTYLKNLVLGTPELFDEDNSPVATGKPHSCECETKTSM